MIVYKITNKINGKAYIGQTIKPMSVRWYQHTRVDAKGNYCRALKAATKKYRINNFYYEILSICSSRDQLNTAEEYFIEYYQTFGDDNGYNLTTGGDSRINTEYSNKLRSLALKGRPRTWKNLESTRQKMSLAKKGKPAWNKGTRFINGSYV